MSNGDETYNGWTNRATWHTNLVISNDPDSYRYWDDKAKYYAESPAYLLAGEMEAEIGREHVPEDCATQSINWREIASVWHEEAREALDRDGEL